MADLLDLMGCEPVPRRRPREPIARYADKHPMGVFRWSMQRRWGTGAPIGWLLKNPSDADGKRDDPTTWRVIDFTEDWGSQAAVLVNIWPFVSPKPADALAWRNGADQAAVRQALDENQRRAAEALSECRIVVAAYGVLDDILAGDLCDWLAHARVPLRAWRCLGLTADGWPKHPLARGKHRVAPGTAAKPFKPHEAIDALTARAAA